MPDAKPVLNPDTLTPRDLIAARKALPDINVSEALTDSVLMIPLTIFCLRRRDDPEFTWDQALDTPMSEFSQPEPSVPPPTLPSEPLGRSGTSPSGNGSNAKPPRRTNAPASSPSTP